MSRIQAATPSDVAVTITLPRVYDLVFTDDPITVTAKTAANSAPGATSWEVRDFWDNVVASGAWSGTSVTIGTAGQGLFTRYGFHSFHLLGPDHGDGAWTTDYGTMRFDYCENSLLIPTAPLRSSNPSFVSAGLDAPLAHKVLSLGGVRLSANVQNLNARRQQTVGFTASGKTVSLAAPETTTTNSVLTIVHAIVGDDTGATGPGAGWILDGSSSQGSGATKVSVRIYRRYGQVPQSTIFTCGSTNNAAHSMYWVENGPYILNQPPTAIQFFTGNGNAAAITKDLRGVISTEYVVVTGVVGAAGGATSETSTPRMDTVFGVGNIFAGTVDPFGGGTNHSITYNLSNVTDYVGFFIAYPGDPSGFGSYSVGSTNAQLDMWWSVWGQYAHTNRPFRKVSIAFPVTSANAVTNYAEFIKQAVAASNQHIPGFVGCYSGRNEPQGNYSMQENNSFAASVRAGDPTAIPGGPGFVSMGYNGAAQPDFFAKADQGMFDPTTGMKAIGYHDYNGCVGDVALTLNILRSLRAGIVARGLDTLPTYMTEGSHDTTWWPGIFRLTQTGTAYMLNMVAREIILRVPFEHQYYYYDRRAGFDSVTTWQMPGDGGVYPGYAMHRAFACRVNDKVMVKELYFGSLNDYIVGGVWKNPQTNDSVMAMIGTTGQPAITFAVGVQSGSIPTTLTAYDCWGNQSTINVVNKTFTLTPSEVIQYVDLPAGVSIGTRVIPGGQNFLKFAPSVAITDSLGFVPTQIMRKLIDDMPVSQYAWGTSDPSQGSVYNTSGSSARYINFIPGFSQTVPCDTLRAYITAAWQAMGAVLKGSLQYTLDGTNWITPPGGSWDHTADIKTRKRYDLYSDTLVDAYTEPQHFFQVSLGGVKLVKGVRLEILSVSNGMYLDALMNQPTGTANSGGQAPSVCIAEIQALNESANVIHPAMA